MHVKTTTISKHLSTDCVHQSESNKWRIYFSYALLDTGSQSTLVCSDFVKRLNLRKNFKIVNITSIIDLGELFLVDEVKLHVMDVENTSRFHMKNHWPLKEKDSIFQHSFFHYISNKMKNGPICKY